MEERIVKLELDVEEIRDEKNKAMESLERLSILAEAQVAELKALRETIAQIRKRDECQDKDIERVKQICHEFLKEKKNRIMAVSGGAGLSGAVLVEVALEIWRHM